MADGSQIQRPEILHRLQQFLGLREAHVTPTLLPGVQAVVVIGDVRETGAEKRIARPCAAAVRVLNIIGTTHAILLNPTGSRVVIGVQSIYQDNGSFQWALVNSNNLEGGVPGDLPAGFTRGNHTFRDRAVLAPLQQLPLPVGVLGAGDFAGGPIVALEFWNTVPDAAVVAGGGIRSYPRGSGGTDPSYQWTLQPGVSLIGAQYISTGGEIRTWMSWTESDV